MAKYFKSDDGKQVFRRDTTTSLNQMITQEDVQGTNGTISIVTLDSFPVGTPVPDGFAQTDSGTWNIHREKLSTYLDSLD